MEEAVRAADDDGDFKVSHVSRSEFHLVISEVHGIIESKDLTSYFLPCLLGMSP